MNKYNKIIIPLLVIVLLNLIEHGFYLISIERPVFYYEYLAIPLVFTFISNKLIRLLIITFIVISDAIISLAQFYFFDTFKILTYYYEAKVESYKVAKINNIGFS